MVKLWGPRFFDSRQRSLDYLSGARHLVLAENPRWNSQRESGEIERQIGVITGIVAQELAPPLLHVIHFRGRVRVPFRADMIQAQIGIWRPNNLQVMLPKPEAKIDVMEMMRQIFGIKSSDFVKDFSSNRQAGA